ncbi:MAG: hypothetical protein ABI790_14880, partial [Betaproteobacteria bacterium]
MKIEELLMYQTDVLMLPVGHTLFNEGDPGDAMYVLVSGTADVLLRGKVVESATSGAISSAAPSRSLRSSASP